MCLHRQDAAPPEARRAILGRSSEHLVTIVAHCVHQPTTIFLFGPGLPGHFDKYLGEVLPNSRFAGADLWSNISGSRALPGWRLIAWRRDIVVQAVIIVREVIPVLFTLRLT